MVSRRWVTIGALMTSTVLTATALTGCSAAGVDVSHDWGGVAGLVLAEVNGLQTVVGIDVTRHQARSLIVIPDTSSDSDVLSPLLARRADGVTYLTRPLNSGASTVYQVRNGSDSVDGVGTLTSGGRLLGVTGGWAEVSPSDTGSTVRLLSDTLTTRQSIDVAVQPRAAATDNQTLVCLTDSTDAGSRAGTADVRDGVVSGTSLAAGVEATSVGCWNGQALIAGAAAGLLIGPEAAPVPLRWTDDAVATVQIGATRLDRFTIDGDTATAVVSRGAGTALLTIDLATRSVTHDIALAGLSAANDFFADAGHWVVVGDTSAAVVDRTSGAVSMVDLPGRVGPS